jgi:hypothetical protein
MKLLKMYIQSNRSNQIKSVFGVKGTRLKDLWNCASILPLTSNRYPINNLILSLIPLFNNRVLSFNFQKLNHQQ